MLIPCHVESPRRLLLFIRCLKSVSLQVCHNSISEYDVFISVSGPAEYRENALNFVAKIKSTSMSTEPGKIAWHVYDTKKHALPQMEHLRNLVEKSERKDSDASLLFLDNDDMFHPMRLMAFQEALDNLMLPPETPLPLSCKLLLNENMRPGIVGGHDQIGQSAAVGGRQSKARGRGSRNPKGKKTSTERKPRSGNSQ